LKVLLLENISAVALEQFRAAGYEVESHKAALEERDLVEKVRGAAILGVRSKTPVSKAVIQAGEKLVAVGAFCIGVDKIDRATANERGIAVFNDPHSNSRSVAELAVGEIIVRAINDILGDRGINIERQVLDTRGTLGYAIYDINRPCDADLMALLRAVPHTIGVRAAGG